jgi:hypothetical protein
MEDDRDIIKLKQTIKGLDKTSLIEVLLYIDELIKAYGDRHKV